MRVELELVVRSTEIDINGHVNNAKYLEYLEWGREEWFEKAGLHYETFLEMGLQTVTVNININYRKECRQGDRLTVVTFPKTVGRSSFVLDQEIWTNGELCTDAVVTAVTMDAETRKSHPVPKELRDLFNQVSE